MDSQVKEVQDPEPADFQATDLNATPLPNYHRTDNITVQKKTRQHTRNIKLHSIYILHAYCKDYIRRTNQSVRLRMLGFIVGITRERGVLVMEQC